MPNVNNVTLCGHLTRDAEKKYVGAKGTCLTTFGIAVSKKFGDKEVTGFYDVKCWGSTAEAAAELRKGEAAIAIGELNLETWEDKNTGGKRSKVVVQADVVGRALYVRKDGPRTAEPAATPRPQARPAPAAAAAPSAQPADDDDVPF